MTVVWYCKYISFRNKYQNKLKYYITNNYNILYYIELYM
nr:MAG TPA: hypothetical protein [Caudoviricetes sp.]